MGKAVQVGRGYPRRVGIANHKHMEEMAMGTKPEAITNVQKAVNEANLGRTKKLENLVHYMRYSMGMNYKDQAKFFVKNTTVEDEGEFETLMQEVDHYSSNPY